MNQERNESEKHKASICFFHDSLYTVRVRLAINTIILIRCAPIRQGEQPFDRFQVHGYDVCLMNAYNFEIGIKQHVFA